MTKSDNRTYIAIDLKSFYASVECVERGLNPLVYNLIVADAERTNKTICLAVSPALKSFGIPGRPRLFEVESKVRAINAERKMRAPGRMLTSTSYNAEELRNDPGLALDYIIAPPRLRHYMEYSTNIYNIYLKYIAPEDIHVYSIDEVFMDVTNYLSLYRMTPRKLAMTIILDVLKNTGITATAGIGTNLYLSKIAMDIHAKRMKEDKNGVRIAELDEQSYRRIFWNHRPLTDFWRIGRGYARKLEAHGLFTMGDIARCSLGKPEDYCNENLLFRLFGVNAELLIDHAWGIEPCTIADIKAYRPVNSSLSSGQVLHIPYDYDSALLIVKEMTDMMVLDMVDKNLLSDQLVLHISYDVENLLDPIRRSAYHGSIDLDHYGREVPKSAHGSINLPYKMSSSRQMLAAMEELYRKIVDKSLLIRKITISANQVVDAREEKSRQAEKHQLSLFDDFDKPGENKEEADKEKRQQEALLAIKKKFGKNAILKGMNLEEGATAKERNKQVGGHKA